jgi:chemotaxis signal transduction protein
MSDVHVQVRVGSELYALPVAHVLEVGEIGALTVAPGASRATLGVRNLRGESPQRMLVAERNGTRAGFAVDEVTDVDELPEADQDVDSELLSSAALIDGSLVGVIDVDRLFDTLERAA